jgi:hypothetical protein
MSGLGLGTSHAVADLRLRQDVPWVTGVVAQLAAKVPYEGPDKLIFARVFRPTHVME